MYYYVVVLCQLLSDTEYNNISCFWQRSSAPANDDRTTVESKCLGVTVGDDLSWTGRKLENTHSMSMLCNECNRFCPAKPLLF